MQKQFYEKLYTSDQGVNCSIQIEPERKLTDIQKDELDKPITVEEIQNSIKTMARNKSPGSDGLQVEFYACFWLRVRQPMMDAFNYALRTGCMHESARVGIISLIPKRNNLQDIRNWRPIVLLNSDYKVLSKTIASRIKGVLQDIINSDQTGFMANRSIFHNIRKLIDVMDYSEMCNIPIVILSIDFMKAFDRVEYASIYKVMKWFNFGNNIVNWVATLFNQFKLATINNGYTSDYFSPTRGLFQGNPIASYLFVILIELLAVQFRNNKKIRGLKIKDQEILLVQFADDLGLVLDYDQRVWEETIKVFDNFQHMSGMLINYEKSVVYRVGSLRNSNAKYYSNRKLFWTKKPFKVLGVHLHYDTKQMFQHNILPLMQKARSVLSMWIHRGLSLMGKILVINSLVSSLFVYQLTVSRALSGKIHKEIQEIFHTFIWNNKRAKIRYDILEGLKTDGGLGLVNMVNREKALKIRWVQKVHEDEKIRALANALLRNESNLVLWNCQMTRRHIEILFPYENFWTDVLREWADYSLIIPTTLQEVEEQPLWYNSRILIGGEPIYYHKWSKNGLNYVKDLFEKQGEFVSYEMIMQKMGRKVPYTEYAGLKTALPREWFRLMQNKTIESTNINLLQQTCENKKNAQIIYRRLSTDRALISSKVLKMSYEIQEELEIEEYIRYITNITKITISVKLRSFQYPLLLNAIVTNNRLKMMKIVDSDKCSLCSNAIETIKHLFYECTRVKEIWNYVCNKYKIRQLSYKEIISNDVDRNPRIATNCIVLIAKHYIYITRCLGNRASREGCEEYIKNYINIEESIAKAKNKTAQHEIKWRDYL